MVINGFVIDLLDPSIFAAGVAVGSIVTAKVIKRKRTADESS